MSSSSKKERAPNPAQEKKKPLDPTGDHFCSTAETNFAPRRGWSLDALANASGCQPLDA